MTDKELYVQKEVTKLTTLRRFRDRERVSGRKRAEGRGWHAMTITGYCDGFQERDDTYGDPRALCGEPGWATR